MNSRRGSRRRFRVVARPQQKARRARLFGAVVAVGLLGLVAIAAGRHAAGVLVRARAALPAAVSAGPEAAIVDGPEAVRALAQAAADSVVGSAAEKAAEIKRRLPCVEQVLVRRPWGESRASLTPVLRRAIAPLVRGGKPAGFLSDDGVAFAAPEGAYALSAPPVDAAGAGEDDLKGLAREWPALTAPGALPSPLTAMSWSAAEGWRADLEDGTRVLWGRMEWTKEKLARLSEALGDARSKEPGAFSADLRWFEDGKVLLRPASAPKTVAPKAVVAVRGGVR